jgi:ElaB/YqjD/DUF883 family membrane-anchored ribosome-binding protein
MSTPNNTRSTPPDTDRDSDEAAYERHKRRLEEDAQRIGRNAGQAAREMRDRVQDRAENLGDHARDRADELFDRVQQGAEHFGEKARHQAQRAADAARAGEERVEEWHDTVRRNVRKHPTTALVAAIGLGVVVGRIIGR